MPRLPTARPKLARKLARSWTPDVCFYVFRSLDPLTSFIKVFVYIIYFSRRNFKLKGKECGLKDIELMPGWGPFVEESEYQGFIAGYVDQPEVITTLFFCPILRAE